MTKIAVWKVDPTKSTFPIVRMELAAENSGLDQVSQQLPGGAYTTLRTYHHDRVLRLAEHFERLEETARLAGIAEINLDRTLIRSAIRDAVQQFSDSGETRIRITLDMEVSTGAVYLALEELQIPAAQEYELGVNVMTQRMYRQNPKAKLTGFIAAASHLRQETPAGINETLMVDDQGEILEGLSSNFFGVVDGKIWTAEARVLSGITRGMVLEAAKQENIPVELRPLYLYQLTEIQEAFLTSVSRGVLPVRAVDGKRIGSGTVGAITRKLSDRFRENIHADLEDI
jgi:branched-chain amino acid aminotransferase